MLTGQIIIIDEIICVFDRLSVDRNTMPNRYISFVIALSSPFASIEIRYHSHLLYFALQGNCLLLSITIKRNTSMTAAIKSFLFRWNYNENTPSRAIFNYIFPVEYRTYRTTCWVLMEHLWWMIYSYPFVSYHGNGEGKRESLYFSCNCKSSKHVAFNKTSYEL